MEFEQAFPRLFARSYRVALRMVGDKGEAEDVAAEALARTLRAWRRVRLMASPEAWVVRVTTNLAIDLLRRRRKHSESALADHAGRSDDLDTRIFVREMVRSLPRRQRDVLALRYLADLSEADIAKVLGIAPGSVKTHASRGIDRLRKRLVDQDADGATEVIRIAF